jgi:hypothetical protein
MELNLMTKTFHSRTESVQTPTFSPIRTDRKSGAAVNKSPVNDVPLIVHDVLHSPGQPLDYSTRASMEPRFGHDFSKVRVHADTKAAESAGTVNALAYTVGRDVVFGLGQYAPATTQGRKLLVHELAHVVQQGSGYEPGRPEALRVAPHDHYENAAEAVASRFADGQNASLSSAGISLGLQRAEEPGKTDNDQEDTCAQFENDHESFSIMAAKHFLTEVEPGASQMVKTVECEVSPTDPQRMECDVTFSDGQKIHVTWIKNLNNVEAQRPTPDGRQWCVYHYVCDTPGSARYEKKGCSSNVNPRPSSPSGPDLVGSRPVAPGGGTSKTV